MRVERGAQESLAGNTKKLNLQNPKTYVQYVKESMLVQEFPSSDLSILEIW